MSHLLDFHVYDSRKKFRTSFEFLLLFSFIKLTRKCIYNKIFYLSEQASRKKEARKFLDENLTYISYEIGTYFARDHGRLFKKRVIFARSDHPYAPPEH